MDPILAQSLRWYTFLASQPGWKAQALHSAKQLAKDHPSVYWRLPELLTEAMQRSAADADPSPR